MIETLTVLRTLSLGLGVGAAALASGCAPMERHATASGEAGTPPAIVTVDLSCDEPAFLVRDLTAAYAQRRYLVGPCDGGERRRAVIEAVHAPGGPRGRGGGDDTAPELARPPASAPVTPVSAGERARR